MSFFAVLHILFDFSIPWLSFNNNNDQSRQNRAFRPGNPVQQQPTNQRPQLPDRLANQRLQQTREGKSAGKLAKATEEQLRNDTR